MWRPAIRIVVLFAIIIGFSVALGAYMNYSSVRTAYLDAIHSRMHVVAADIVQVIETAQSLGIALAAQHMLPPLLEERYHASPLLQSIDVFGAQHRILFSSAAARVGVVLDQPILQNNPYREVEPIVNTLGITTGGLLLRFDRKAIAHQLRELAGAIIDAALRAVLAALAIGGGGIMLLLIRLRHKSASPAELVARNPATRDAVAVITNVHEQIEREASTFGGPAR